MTDAILGGKVNKALTVALDGLATRQRVISNNLANVDTPGFKTSEVRFEDALRNALAKDRPSSAGNSANLDAVQPQIVRLGNTSRRLDGNNVDIDKEMIDLAETTIAYSSLVQLTASRVSMARYAVNEGRR